MAIHLIFFKDANGNIQLPPTDDTPCPPSYMRCEANTLAEVDELERQLQRATRERCEREILHDEVVFAAARDKVRSDLTARLSSAATSDYEKEFIREYLKLRIEKRSKYHARFACDTAYLEIRHNDKPRNAEELLQESL